MSIVYISVVLINLSYGFIYVGSVGSLWVLCGFSVGSLWVLCGFSVGSLWVLCGFSVGSLWVLCGFSVGSLWVLCGFSVGSLWVLCGFSVGSLWVLDNDCLQLCSATSGNISTNVIGYEPAGLTVHPPPRMIEGGFIFFVWVSSVTKIFSSKKSGFCRRYSHRNAPKRGFTS